MLDKEKPFVIFLDHKAVQRIVVLWSASNYFLVRTWFNMSFKKRTGMHSNIKIQGVIFSHVDNP
jgi:hypothetical protein